MMPPLTLWLTDRLPDLLASPLAARLGWTCLHSLWQALAIASLLAAGCMTIGSCRTRRMVVRGQPHAGLPAHELDALVVHELGYVRRQAHALALAANGGSLLDRIRRLAGVEEQPASPVRPLAAAVTASLIVAVLVMAAAPIREARADELPKDTNQIESLTVEQAKKLVKEFPGVTVEVTRDSGSYRLEKCLPVNGLKKLMPDVAQALAGYSRGPLFLNGLTTLSAEAAKALAQHKGSLSLIGLTTLSGEAATALAQHKGELQLASISFSLTPDSVLVWATLLRGQLSAVTALDSPDAVAIAKALATRKDPLSLPNLKKISPKTLSALIEKEDIEIPLIETLELIPEPDGSVTDDFVIPEGFQERQKRQRQ